MSDRYSLAFSTSVITTPREMSSRICWSYVLAYLVYGIFLCAISKSFMQRYYKIHEKVNDRDRKC